jgi:hypothetical protein
MRSPGAAWTVEGCDRWVDASRSKAVRLCSWGAGAGAREQMDSNSERSGRAAVEAVAARRERVAWVRAGDGKRSGRGRWCV